MGGLILILIVLAIVAPCAIYTLINNHISTKKNIKELERFKQSAIKLEVDLSECEIKSSQSTFDVPNLSGIAQVWDQLYDAHSSVKTHIVNNIVLLYSCDFKGQQTLFHSGIIHLDLDRLKWALLLKETTYIYVDRCNINKYYFDMEFLPK